MAISQTIEIDLMRDFTEIAASLLNQYGFTKPTVTDVKNEQRQILIDFFGFMHRKIQQKPRNIYKPAGFACPPEYQAGLNMLEEKIRNGEDLTPYQSRKILAYKKRDALLNDWGIQHLHLGTEMETGRPLIKGTSEVLFVFFKDEDAYFITIMGHDNWTDQDMLRILHDNFPKAIESWRLNDVIGLTHVPTDEEVAQLRNANVVSGVEIYPGVVYLGPGGGYSSNGTSIIATLLLNKYQRFVDRITKEVNDKESYFRQQLERKYATVPATLKMNMRLENEIFVIFEANTGAIFTKVHSNKIAD